MGRRMDEGRRVVAALALFAGGCSVTPVLPPLRAAGSAAASQDVPAPEGAEARVEPIVLDDRAPIGCADVTRENTLDGLVRIHFDRIYFACTPEQCGSVMGPQDMFAFAGYLQERLVREPGCEQCQLANITGLAVVDADLWVEGRWRFQEHHQEWSFFLAIPPYAPPERTARLQLESASFAYNRGEDGFEGYFHALCPGSPEDPDAPGPRVVSDECMTFRSQPSGEAHPIFIEGTP